MIILIPVSEIVLLKTFWEASYLYSNVYYLVYRIIQISRGSGDRNICKHRVIHATMAEGSSPENTRDFGRIRCDSEASPMDTRAGLFGQTIKRERKREREYLPV